MFGIPLDLELLTLLSHLIWSISVVLFFGGLSLVAYEALMIVRLPENPIR